MAVALLCMRVKDVDEDDYKKLLHYAQNEGEKKRCD
jgi:hypothetical protein